MNLHVAPQRLARMLLRVQRYNATVKYVPGKQILLADSLYRINPCLSSGMVSERTLRKRYMCAMPYSSTISDQRATHAT